MSNNNLLLLGLVAIVVFFYFYKDRQPSLKSNEDVDEEDEERILLPSEEEEESPDTMTEVVDDTEVIGSSVRERKNDFKSGRLMSYNTSSYTLQPGRMAPTCSLRPEQ